MIKKHFFYISIVTALAFLMACGGNKFDVDISKIDLKLSIYRLDKDLMLNYPDTSDVYKLIEKYGNFIDLYGQYIISIGSPSQKEFSKKLVEFNNYCNDNKIPAEVDRIYGNFADMESQLTTAFKYYKYYFPKSEIPKIYCFLSGFNYSVITDQGVLGIGLDNYLGVDYSLYQINGIDNYKSRKMHKDMLPVDCMRAWAKCEFPFNDSASDMVNNMVYEGKIQYFIDAMLPFAADSLKFGYTKDQYEWADYNEHKMWAYMVENKLLFTTDELTIKKMIDDGPFTTLFANNSAPRAGAFLGWKIVNRYMKKNPKITLEQLMHNDDYQGILNAASYKP
jgi:hypothetical protein